MDVVTYSDFQADVKAVIDRVIGDRTHVVVARPKAEAVVVVGLDEWNSIQETMHLLSSPKNAERLRESIREIEEGKGVERELIQP